MRKALMIGIALTVILLVIIFVTYRYYQLGVAADDAAVAEKLAGPKRSPEEVPPTNCPVTKPVSPPFVPPRPWDALRVSDVTVSNVFWYGSDQLWTDLPNSGIWKGLHLNYARKTPVYSYGVMWGRKGYDRHTEPHPRLKIKGRRIDAQAAPLLPRDTGFCCTVFDGPEPPTLMLADFDLPTLGCWEITGQYNDHSLTFVVWTTDRK